MNPNIPNPQPGKTGPNKCYDDVKDDVKNLFLNCIIN